MTIDLSSPVIMGILNVTPDSFSDGGKFNSLDNALRQAEYMVKNGARILDVGGESTRPGSQPVDAKTECERVIPVIKKLKSEFDCVISLDTSKAEVMSEGLEAGIDIINDVCALGNPGSLEVAAQTDVPVCLMHMKGTPATMQIKPHYEDVVEEVMDFFDQRINICEQAGIRRERLWLDPGYGFGKSLNDNYNLLQNLDRFSKYKLPILAGLSRKSMLGNLLNLETSDRMVSSVVAATLALTKGANILRVHDVEETHQAVQIYNAMVNGVGNE
ncbi:dihydropteroate synthase [Psychrosphaera ytuae]|uniref:Dihydropteroate synthase n=1 Tax=Psychrosphaera ytuae TaxID=2820710 RepID=A0A975DCZ2_9GAMM|nr:dihydropteroate synthase [Psychrosphaera ytuae]QTH64880.1 dihydropteroate synthase [Psychrosphaera ytuae]